MSNPFRAIRQFERLLFRGVPDQPEPVWQRITNANVFDRLSGRSQIEMNQASIKSKSRVVAEIVYEPVHEKITIIENRKLIGKKIKK